MGIRKSKMKKGNPVDTINKEDNIVNNNINNINNRPPIKAERSHIDDYFLKIASVVAERSTCRRHNVGAIAVKDRHILATAYNGAPSGIKDCLELGCLRNQMKIPSGTRHEICRAVHAEQNIVIQAALHGTNIKEATIYCTHPPCILCAKMLVNAKIKRFVTYGEYADDSFVELFKEANIQVDFKEKPDERIKFLP